jgi:lipase ATG15
LILDLVKAFPQANVWLVGHSLGGSLASLLGATFGIPAVAFEAPGERMAAYRLHLPIPPLPNSTSPPNIQGLAALSYAPVPVTHVYHTADPIPQGKCTGFISPCAQAGFALETGCHLGKSIVYDTMGKLGWLPDVRTHIIKAVIQRILEDDSVDWGEESGGGDDGEGRQRREVPEPKREEDCEVRLPLIVILWKRTKLIELYRTVIDGSLVIFRTRSGNIREQL